jgi:5S rRNA maturation endonuclease (ribonuclease M5)
MAVMMKKNWNNEDRQDFRFNLERLKESIDPRYLLETLGFSIIRETSKELRCSCRVHGGDNKTSFRFNKDTKTWVCFSHRCHDVFGNDIIGLIKGCNSVEFVDAVKFLKSIAGEIGSGDYLEYKRKREKDAFIRSRRKLKSNSSIVTEDCLRQFKPFRSSFFENQGFTKETLDFFEIAGGYTDGYGYIRDIIPIRGVKGDLVGYSMRDVRENVDDVDFKYIHTEDFDKDKVIYNLNNAKEYLKEKPLIVVEGFKSVWRMHQMGIKNVGAVMGAHITPGQRNLLYTYAQEGVVLFFDGDAPGIAGTVRMIEELRGKIEKLYTIFITEEDLDPADLDDETLLTYLNGYI